MPARRQVIDEMCTDHGEGEWNLCFQWCRYVYDDGTNEHGYRFIWRRAEGSLQPGRGQERIPSVAVLEGLVAAAKRKGWGDLTAE